MSRSTRPEVIRHGWTPAIRAVLAVALFAACWQLTTAGEGADAGGLLAIDKNGTGSGGPNQNSSLTATCPGAAMVVVGGGFSGFDAGTRFVASAPTGKRSWVVTWRNDSSADTVTLRILCQDFNLALVDFRTKTQPGPGGPNQSSSLNIDCGQGGLFAGGVSSVDAGTALTASRPSSYRQWLATWVNDGSADAVGISAVCFIPTARARVSGNSTIVVSKTGTVTNTGTVTVACPVGLGTGGGGFSGVAGSSRLVAARHLDLERWAVTLNARGSADEFKVWMVCRD